MAYRGRRGNKWTTWATKPKISKVLARKDDNNDADPETRIYRQPGSERKFNGGKRWVLSWLQNFGDEDTLPQRKWQVIPDVGAEKEKALQPEVNLINVTVKRCLSIDLRWRDDW